MSLLILVAILKAAITSAQFQFGKKLAVTDPDFTTFFTPISTETLASPSLCAAVAYRARTKTNKTARPSAFLHYSSNSTCILGRSPTYTDAYIENPPVPYGDNGAYLLLNKPRASIVNADTWFYTLLNEEHSAYYSHPNFIKAWPTGYTPSLSNLVYSVASPVMSYNGQFAASFSASSTNTVKFVTPGSTPVSEFTILVWYNSGSPTAIYSSPLVSLCVADQNYTAEFWIDNPNSLSTPARLFSGVSPDNGVNWFPWYSTSNVVPPGVWTYVGLTFSRATQTVSHWVNGTQQGSTPISSVPNVPNFSLIYIGQSCKVAYATVTIASVEVYMRSLNQTDILAAMAKSYTARTTTGSLPDH